MKRQYIFGFLILLLSSCGGNVEKTTASQELATTTVQLTDVQVNNAEIKTELIQIKNLSEILKLNGKIDVPPQNLISISVPMGGYLKSTDMLPGMSVKKGQVLAILEDPQYVQLQQEYLLAKVKLKLSESEYNRQKELNESKAASDKVLQQAEAEYKNQRINVQALAENLRLIGVNPERLDDNKISKSVTINSPIDGYVARVNANIGKYLTSSEVLFELVNTTDIHLNLTVYEKDIDKLKIGQKVMAYTNSNPNQKEECNILLIGQSLATDKSTEVHCHFKNYNKKLVPGMYMNAEIELESSPCIAIPETAIVRFGNEAFVFIELRKNEFEMIAIREGKKENGYVELIGGENLKGQTIVSNGAYSLLMKLKNTEE